MELAAADEGLPRNGTLAEVPGARAVPSCFDAFSTLVLLLPESELCCTNPKGAARSPLPPVWPEKQSCPNLSIIRSEAHHAQGAPAFKK